MSAQLPETPAAAAVRWFGRLQLLRLLGKSERTMAWRVADPRSGQELMLVLPRVQPADADALAQWQLALRQAARLNHPHLAAVVEVGVQDGWPFVAYDPLDSATLAERSAGKGLPGAEAVALAAQALQGLAFAHDAGVAHGDLQPFHLLVSDSGQVRVAGAAVAAEMMLQQRHAAALPSTDSAARREDAERDVLAMGLLMHGLLVGSGALDERDIGVMIARLPPVGRDIVRLPWSTAHKIAEPLRAIVNRATDRQERQRYRNARTLLRALEGWLQTDTDGEAGPLALLADRIRLAGVLPSSPGAAARAKRLARMERERTNELAEVVLEDLALSFEMLRLVNSAQVRGAQAAGSGPILTVRRAISMLGLDGVRRAASGLREWPGPLREAGVQHLQTLIDACKRAARLAIALRPAGYDGEVVYLLTLLQNLGRLVVQYHFAEEAQQIRRLMQPAPPARAGEPEEPGMSEEAAGFAVLGADIESIGAAVARQWGLDDSVLLMARRIPPGSAGRGADNDADILRVAASCANETIDALALPAARVLPALQRVIQRHGRSLGLSLRDLQSALQNPDGAAIAQTEQGTLEPIETQPGSLRKAAAARAGTAP